MASRSSSFPSRPACPPPRYCPCTSCEQLWQSLSLVARSIRLKSNPFRDITPPDDITSNDVVLEQRDRDLFRRLARLLREGTRRTGAESWAIRREVWDALVKP